jgi:hypothetical protein
MMIVKHLISFLVLLAVTCGAFTRLSVIDRKNKLAGAVVEDVYMASILLHKPGTSSYYNSFNTQGLRALKESIRFEGGGALRVLSSELELRATMVQWKAQEPNGLRDANYSAPGVEMVARVKWQVSPTAADGEAGDIHLAFSKAVSNAACEPLVHGRFEKRDNATFMAAEATAYQSTLAWYLGRCQTALVLALPVAGFFNALIWAVVLHLSVKKLASLRAGEPVAGTYYFPAPPRLDDWRHACIILGLCCMPAFIPVYSAAADQHMPSFLSAFILSFCGAGLLFAAAMLVYLPRVVVSVRMDAETISIAKGRREPLQWDTARWEELRLGRSASSGFAAMASGAATILGSGVPALAGYSAMSQRWVKMRFPSKRSYTLTAPACIKQAREYFQARLQELSRAHAQPPAGDDRSPPKA